MKQLLVLLIILISACNSEPTLSPKQVEELRETIKLVKKQSQLLKDLAKDRDKYKEKWEKAQENLRIKKVALDNCQLEKRQLNREIRNLEMDKTQSELFN